MRLSTCKSDPITVSLTLHDRLIIQEFTYINIFEKVELFLRVQNVKLKYVERQYIDTKYDKELLYEPVRKNTIKLGSAQVRHKPGGTVKEDG